MLTQRQFDFFHNILRVFITRNVDDYITERVNRLLKRSDLKGFLCGKENVGVLLSGHRGRAKTTDISDRSRCDFWCAYIAALMVGARWVERHFTLDRTWKGTDHAASLEPDGLRRLCRDVRNVAMALRYKECDLLAVELVQRAKLKRT